MSAVTYARWWCPASRVWNVPGWTRCSCKRVGGVLGSVPACHPCVGEQERMKAAG